MISILKRVHKQSDVVANPFFPDASLPYLDSLLQLAHSTANEKRYCNYLKANCLLKLGEEEQGDCIV